MPKPSSRRRAKANRCAPENISASRAARLAPKAPGQHIGRHASEYRGAKYNALRSTTAKTLKAKMRAQAIGPLTMSRSDFDRAAYEQSLADEREPFHWVRGQAKGPPRAQRTRRGEPVSQGREAARRRTQALVSELRNFPVKSAEGNERLG